IREKVGIVFGNPETTSGGRALKFYSSVRVEVRRGETIKNGTEMIGCRTKAKIVKNKVAPPFKQAEFDIMYGRGISATGNILDLAAEMKIIDKAGSWFSYQGERIGQGRENAKDYLENNPEMMLEIEKQVRDKAFATASGEGEKADGLAQSKE
ncbi:MAG: DNA recombination/repair protein RecA, partial [Clostridia bacterium]|nr:DNA recombination/repair protein RecA [Clostridia bacterium]